MINTVVIDKESSIMRLKPLLQEYCPEVALCGEFTSASVGMQKLSSLNFDLLLLGLPLDDFAVTNLSRLLAVKRFQMLATYASNLHTIENLQTSVSDFLSLPFTGNNLRMAMSNVLQQILADNLLRQIDSSYSFCKSDNLVINLQHQFLLIPVPQIRYCKAATSYTEIHHNEEPLKMFAQGQYNTNLVTLASRPLSYFDPLLLPKGFIRIHNSYLVNKKYIRVITRQIDKVILDDDTEIPVSRTKKEALMKEMI